MSRVRDLVVGKTEDVFSRYKHRYVHGCIETDSLHLLSKGRVKVYEVLTFILGPRVSKW